MDTNDLEYVSFISDGYVQTMLPQEIYLEFQKQIKEIQKDNFSNSVGIERNKRLVGNIEHEYAFKVGNNFQSFIDRVVRLYVDKTTIYERDYITSPITHTWINFQKKYEFNPIHVHDADLSFVAWLKIPYTLEDEKNAACTRKNSVHEYPTTTNFFFIHHIGTQINVNSFDVNENSVGKLILFNSQTHHYVCPFYTSDDYRISIAGNIKLNYYNSVSFNYG